MLCIYHLWMIISINFSTCTDVLIVEVWNNTRHRYCVIIKLRILVVFLDLFNFDLHAVLINTFFCCFVVKNSLFWLEGFSWFVLFVFDMFDKNWGMSNIWIPKWLFWVLIVNFFVVKYWNWKMLISSLLFVFTCWCNNDC